MTEGGGGISRRSKGIETPLASIPSRTLVAHPTSKKGTERRGFESPIPRERGEDHREIEGMVALRISSIATTKTTTWTTRDGIFRVVGVTREIASFALAILSTREEE